jgi:hypothetical protein
MTSYYEASQFLQEFKSKLGIWGVVYLDNRGKNIQALLDLDIKPIERDQVLENLQAEDYVEGPVRGDVVWGESLWVFGKAIKGEEVYIKISIGKPNNRTICISFHVAEYTLFYPLKKPSRQ